LQYQCALAGGLAVNFRPKLMFGRAKAYAFALNAGVLAGFHYFMIVFACFSASAEAVRKEPARRHAAR
jgi:hypothetical protein